MAVVGLVGGLGPESTVDYYRRLLDRARPGEARHAPSIVIDSLDVDLALRLVATDRPALTAYLLASVRRLAAAGVDFVAMTANTPHLVFDEVAAASPVPLISIVAVTAAEAQRLNCRRLLVLGTRFTMDAGFYAATLAQRGIEGIVPAEDDRRWIHAAYVDELLRGTFRDDTRARFVACIEQARATAAVDGVILAGTELPLLLRDVDVGLPMLDTTALHVEAIVCEWQRRPHIRSATQADAGLLAGIGAETFHETFASTNTPEDMAQYLASAFAPEIQARELADARSMFLIAEVNGAAVGYARVMTGDAPACVEARRPLDLARLYVRQAAIGTGVGAALMRACLVEARHRGCDVIWLGVWEHNDRAKAFYERWGFRSVGDQVFVLGSDPQRDLVMSRPVLP